MSNYPPGTDTSRPARIRRAGLLVSADCRLKGDLVSVSGYEELGGFFPTGDEDYTCPACGQKRAYVCHGGDE